MLNQYYPVLYNITCLAFIFQFVAAFLSGVFEAHNKRKNEEDTRN